MRITTAFEVIADIVVFGGARNCHAKSAAFAHTPTSKTRDRANLIGSRGQQASQWGLINERNFPVPSDPQQLLHTSSPGQTIALQLALSLSKTSTRRFRALPASVVLSATGLDEPTPSIRMRSDGTPRTTK